VAKIWFVADGVEIKGRPTERAVLWCKDILGLAPTDWRAPIKHKFVVNDKTPQSDFANPRHVIITIEENEGGWKDGFYYSPMIRIENVKRSLDSN
jgi:hypothetical protein